MATDKTYTEDEHIAVLESRLTKETADLTAERDQLADDVKRLETELDVAESAKVAAEQRAGDAEKALEDFKAEAEQEREAAARKDERIGKVREAASHLTDEFFEDEKRVARIVAMKDDEFEGYLGDLQVSAPPAGSTGAPRETAMHGQSVTPPEKSSTRGFFHRHYVAQEG